MVRGLNKVIVVGDVGRDPELRYTPEGKAVASFSLIAKRSWITSDRKSQQAEEWFNVIAWGEKAEYCRQALHKGYKAYVEGHLQTRSWIGEDNLRKVSTELVLNELIPLGSQTVPLSSPPLEEMGQTAYPMHVNKVMVIGNLESDPERRNTAVGKPYTRFSLMATQSWVTSDGKRCETTEWFHVVTWGTLAEICHQYLAKGRRVYVEGYLHTYTWKNQHEHTHWRTELVANELIILDERQ